MAAPGRCRMVAELVPAQVRETFGELSIPREHVITQQGREYILSDGLLVGLVQLSRGHYDLATEIVQLPTAENAHTAVVTAKVAVFDPETGNTLRLASGIGDASPANVGRLVAGHVLRMAETRGVARALRRLLGVGLTALEELGQGGAEAAPEGPSRPYAAQSASFHPPPGPRATDSINVGGRTFSREEVQRTYHQRVREAKAAGLAGLEELDDLVPGTTPLSLLVGKSQELRRRIDAKAGRSTGK